MHTYVHPVYSVSLENPDYSTWVYTTLLTMVADLSRTEDVITVCHSARLLGIVGRLSCSSEKVSLSKVDAMVHRYEAQF